MVNRTQTGLPTNFAAIFAAVLAVGAAFWRCRPPAGSGGTAVYSYDGGFQLAATPLFSKEYRGVSTIAS
jgi:hypothetical protein